MEKIQDLFIKLVKINSPSGEEKKLGDFVFKKIKKLGLKVKRDKFGNIIARSKKFNREKSILICAHLDTVDPTEGIKPIIKKGIIYSDRTHILGADNKSAIAEIIYALEKSDDFFNVELLFTVQEENGLNGVRNLDIKNIKSKKALVLDYSFPPGYLVLKSPSAIVMDIKISGKSIHSARANQEYNIINVSGICATNMTSFVEPGMNFNIGTIQGGTAVNTAPAFVKMSSGLRSFSESKLDSFIEKNEKELKRIASERNCELSIEKKRVGFGYSHNKDDKLIKELIERFKELRIKPKLEDSMGLSDANILNKYGINAIEIGYGPQNTHTYEEFVTISDMEKMSDFLLNIFKNI
jgi:tripeptide aminopeptidase